MGGFIIIDDGRAVAPNSWGYDRMVEAIADSLPEDAVDFKAWLLNQRISVCVIGSIDVRELTPTNQKLFWNATADAVRRSHEQGAEGWQDPSIYSSWREMFSDLLALRESCLRGEDPCAFNPYMSSVIPATNKKSGPGW